MSVGVKIVAFSIAVFLLTVWFASAVAATAENRTEAWPSVRLTRSLASGGTEVLSLRCSDGVSSDRGYACHLQRQSRGRVVTAKWLGQKDVAPALQRFFTKVSTESALRRSKDSDAVLTWEVSVGKTTVRGSSGRRLAPLGVLNAVLGLEAHLTAKLYE